MDSKSQLPPISRLPLELLLHIFTFLIGSDIVHLLVTCRTHHSMLSSPFIWKDLCARFGVVDLPSAGFHHPDTTFFTVYAQLLHCYGPLLGLWASDNAFQGGIVEFRLVKESKEVGWEGIVGEVWSFPRPMGTFDVVRWNTPSLPVYRQFMRIELRPPTEPLEYYLQYGHEDKNSQAHSGYPVTRSSALRFVREVSYREGRPPMNLSESISSPFMRLNAPHRQAYHVYRYIPEHGRDEANGVHPGRSSSLHPVFPPPTAHHSWLDIDRLMPGLKIVDRGPVDQREAVNGISIDLHQHLIYMAPLPRFDAITGTSMNAPPPPSHPSLTFLPVTDFEDQYEAHAAMYDMTLHPASTMGGFVDLRRMPLDPNPRDLRSLQELGYDDFMVEHLGWHVHWYPLRSPKPPLPSSGESGINSHSHSNNPDPASEAWHPRTLTGLWLGAYDTHGTEVLYIEYNEASCEIQAWKVTGDCNVPRGAITWRFACAVKTLDEEQDALRQYGEVLPTTELLQDLDITEASARTKMRMYAALGTVSQTGYL